MGTDRLSLYNGALRLCGERKLASLTENREPRRLLDDVWNDGAVDYCLEQGMWTFATRTAKFTYDPDVTPQFGFQFAVELPDDFIHLVAVSADEFFEDPLTQYSDENGNLYSNYQTIYVKYVSNDPTYGANLGIWSRTFQQFVQAYLAAQIVAKLTSDKTRLQFVKDTYKGARTDAKSKDALEQPTQWPPRGSWVMARTRGMSRRNRTGGAR